MSRGIFTLLIIIAIIYTLSLIVSAISFLFIPIVILALTCVTLVIIYQVYSEIYFKSKNFTDIKSKISSHIDNCNQLNIHIDELKNSFVNINSYNYGVATLNDDSNYKFKREEWKKSIKNHQIYNCSATIFKNASNQPIKYLCKYFNIETNEDTLMRFESVFNDFAAAEQGKILLKKERNLIIDNISDSIPTLIYRYSKSKLIRKLGFDVYNFTELYFPVYTFQYVSAGGNSSTKCDIELNIENLEKLIHYLNDLIKFRKSMQGQRALMTTALREKIKQRDEFTCQKCSLSVNDEKNLLLEIDHILPISKGGITTEANLQTLCWRCNRSKGAKIEIY